MFIRCTFHVYSYMTADCFWFMNNQLLSLLLVCIKGLQEIYFFFFFLMPIHHFMAFSLFSCTVCLCYGYQWFILNDIHLKSYQDYYEISYSLYVTPCKTGSLKTGLCCIANTDWCSSNVFCIVPSCYLGKSQDGQYLRPSDPAYEQVLDSLAMIARHTPVPLLEALLKWRERWAKSPFLSYFLCFFCSL